MNIIQSVLQAVNNYFTFTSPTERKTLSEVHGNKRIREEDDADENDDVVFVRATTPPKRMRLLDEKCSIFEDVNVEMSSRPSSSTIGTQTNTKQKLGRRNDDEWISLLDDENTTLSPTKFKNTYKAPKHVRYPFKRRERDATHSREPLSSMVAPVRNTVLPSALKFQPRSTPVPKRSFKNFGSSVSLWGLPLFGGGMNRAEYEKLLGSVISNPAKELMRVQPVKVRHGTFVDLTDDADETPTIDLTADEARWPPLAESSRIPTVELEKKSTPRVKPQIITIKDDASETVSPRQKVNRVNSFEEKISKNKFTKSELVSNGIAEYKNYILKFNELEAQHKATSSCGNKFTTEALSDLLEKRIASHLKITESLLDEEVKEVVDEKPVLTDDMLAKVNHALNQSLRLSQVLVTKFKLDITRSDFMTLKNEAWLNDAVINFYMELIVERGETVISYPSVYAFSTFFYPALKNGYDRVRRYTKKVDLFSKDLILVPIHLAVHWCLAKIDMKKKQIVYYDSMLQSNQRVLNMLLDYLSSEYKDKKKTDFDPTGWTTSNDKDIPVQKNGSDCGVFACTFGEYSARQAKFNFTQDDMPYMRKKMVYEILSGKLLVP